MEWQIFLQKINDFKPGADLNLIKKAYDVAYQAHQGQKRYSGEDYITHPLATALKLAEMKLDSKTIAAGLLHDVVDDTPMTNKEIEKQFGQEIAYLIEGVTKLGKIKYRGLERQVENLRKMFLAMAEDIRVVLIKIADRLHNMKTLAALPPQKQRRIALETLEIYAPLANRLGLSELKGELEDLAFPYTHSKDFQWLNKNVKDHYKERENYLNSLKPLLEKELPKEGIRLFEINSRAKHYYSLYKKLQKYDKDLNKIYDLVALRIIVDNLEQCYTVLGVIHKLWRPLPGRIKDYIALPKPNGYRSLHTTVFCRDGKITEFQIRTNQMHEEAKHGIAAHWLYTEQKQTKFLSHQNLDNPLARELKWVQQLKDWQREIDASPDEFLESLKIDFFKDRIFVFTPQGDVIDLPEGATPIDFAYHIHTDIGHRCAEAKIDGKLTALTEPLQNGQIVEIIAKKEAGPSQRWLEYIKTNLAQSRIKNWFKKNQMSEMSEKKEIEKNKQKNKPLPQIKQALNEPKAQINSKLRLVQIGHQTKILFNFAKCCEPQPPQKINGYITVNRGISIHRTDCANLTKRHNPDRLIDVNWK